MNDTYGQKKSETETSRGNEKSQKLRIDADGGADVRRASEKTRAERLTLNRKSRQRGTGALCTLGGILDQLIEDARKQLVKSQECVVWYQSEVKESKEKLENLLSLKQLQESEQEAEDDEDEVNL
jgi:hypothetical protein